MARNKEPPSSRIFLGPIHLRYVVRWHLWVASYFLRSMRMVILVMSYGGLMAQNQALIWLKIYMQALARLCLQIWSFLVTPYFSWLMMVLKARSYGKVMVPPMVLL